MKFITALIFAGLVALAVAEDSDIAKILSKNDTATSTTEGTNDASSSSATSSSVDAKSTPESKPAEDVVVCSRIYKPVCGSNGKTYNNACAMKNEQKLDSNLKIAKEGAC